MCEQCARRDRYEDYSRWNIPHFKIRIFYGPLINVCHHGGAATYHPPSSSPTEKKKKNAEEEEEKPMVYISWIFQIELLIHAGMD